MNRTILLVRGGLGNQLFMLAAGIVFAKSHGSSIRLLDEWYGRASRSRVAEPHTREFLLHRYPGIRDLAPVAGAVETLFGSVSVLCYTRFGLRAPWLVLEDSDGRPERNTVGASSVMYGYFHSYRYFKHLRNELSQLLSLSPWEEARIYEKFETLAPNPARAVAIHVRRGDHIEAERGGVVLDDGYLHRALETLEADPEDILVFSDSPEWCRLNPVFRGATVVDEEDPVWALRMMQWCPSFVMSPSSLSWWAAWLSPHSSRKIIAPQPFIEPSDDLWEANVALDWERLPASFVPGSNPGVTR